MKFIKKKGDVSTIRKVVSDDKKIAYGLVGTVCDFLKANILDYCDYAGETWVFIPYPEQTKKYPIRFGKTREDLISFL